MDLAIQTAKSTLEAFTFQGRTRFTLGPPEPMAPQLLTMDSVLQLGIDAFNWLILADQQNLTHLSLSNDEQCWEETRIDLATRCIEWLTVAEEVKEFALIFKQAGASVQSLPRFMECVSEMTSIVRFAGQNDSEDTMPEWLEDLQFKAIEEHRNGQTVPFVPVEE